MRSTYIRWRELSSPSSYFYNRFKDIVQIGMDDRLLYGLDLGGHLFTIDAFRRTITKLPVPRLRSRNMYLIESTGNVYTVLEFRHRRNGRLRPMKFKVFQLDLLNLAWVKVDDLGDRVALHVSESCSTLVRTRKGMGNRIYFFDGKFHNKQYWNVYDMKNRSIKRGPKFNYEHVDGLSWFMPSLRLRQ
ncbi:hypothetical protein QJS04_geneDACA013757 [Acorus gramineus]|uniref:KIB1-4 beta-propeller domain-containing protein n=1 Tax=Acorus gramineus TaxID=55184 RepID=A0AAV9AYN2_ACOGR|nr:hypothetical protein QJS04_geneDACA013757 [Acorus gramineus]